MKEFKYRHFQGEIILWAVRWYCRFGISYRDLEVMMGERGVSVDHSTVYRWVQCYAPKMKKKLQKYWKHSFSGTFKVDETYLKVKGKWCYLYRAIASQGKTVEFYLSPTRNAKAAKRFLGKAMRLLKKQSLPKAINTDKSSCYPKALKELTKESQYWKNLEHRQVKYLNNPVESDHAKLKRLIKPTTGFKSMKTAHATIQGFEVMLMFRKGQMTPWTDALGEGGEVRLVNQVFGIHAS